MKIIELNGHGKIFADREMIMPTAKQLIQEIDKLSPPERVRLIDQVVRDTIKPDADIENIWAKEVEARWQAFKNGGVETVPHNSVLAKYRNRR